jgi:hypothetical protein
MLARIVDRSVAEAAARLVVANASTRRVVEATEDQSAPGARSIGARWQSRRGGWQWQSKAMLTPAMSIR